MLQRWQGLIDSFWKKTYNFYYAEALTLSAEKVYSIMKRGIIYGYL